LAETVPVGAAPGNGSVTVTAMLAVWPNPTVVGEIVATSVPCSWLMVRILLDVLVLAA
jgi:hypothetical protein